MATAAGARGSLALAHGSPDDAGGCSRTRRKGMAMTDTDLNTYAAVVWQLTVKGRPERHPLEHLEKLASLAFRISMRGPSMDSPRELKLWSLLDALGPTQTMAKLITAAEGSIR